MPKTNTIVGKNQPLQKGLACSRCKARKVRCDAGLPNCSSCERSAAFLGKDPSTISCVYNHTKSLKGKSKAVKAKVARPKDNDEIETPPLLELEDSMDSLQRVIQDNFRPNSYASTSYFSQSSSSSTELESENDFWTRYSSESSEEEINTPPNESDFSCSTTTTNDFILPSRTENEFSYFSLLPYQNQYIPSSYSDSQQQLPYAESPYCGVLVPPSPYYLPFGQYPSDFTNASHLMDTIAPPIYEFPTISSENNFTSFGQLTQTDNTLPWNGLTWNEKSPYGVV